MRLRRASFVGLAICGLFGCNYIVGYNNLKKINREIMVLPDGGLAFKPTHVHVGTNHTCATYGDGSLWCWGRNDAGQLGIGGTDNALVPTFVPHVADVVSFSLGDRHTCATRANGETRCWGANDRGQLGIGASDSRVHDRPELSVEPRLETSDETNESSVTTAPGLKDVVAISAGPSHTCAIAGDDIGIPHVYCWGRNDSGQLGLGHAIDTSVPTAIASH